MAKTAIFDLDGTLVDTVADLGRAVDFVLEQFGITPPWSEQDYRRFVGNGAKKLILRAFSNTLSDGELERAYALFKTKYNEILLDNPCVYAGVRESLDALKSASFNLAVVTNKPHNSAVLMLEKLFGGGYFDCIIGAKNSLPKKPDPCALNLAVSLVGADKTDCIYFGDSDIDVYTAKNAGVTDVACLWGYRSRECLTSAEPTFVISHPKEIAKTALQKI